MRSSASRYGPVSVICEPMWQSIPTTSMPGKVAACLYTATAR